MISTDLLLTTDSDDEVMCRPPSSVGARPVAQSLRHNRRDAATAGIWRVRGSDGSAVLKVFTPPSAAPSLYWRTSDDPTHWNSWRREPLAYTHGLVGAFAPAVTAPGLLEHRARPDGLVELWLEDVQGSDGFGWDVDRLARFASRLGAGQAPHVGRAPTHPWLSRRWLAQYLMEGPVLSVDETALDWDHPSVAAWPGDVRRALRRLWSERSRALALAEAGERTLCHLDVWPANLLDRDGVPVLLDWAFCGEGAVGEDLANLLVDAFADGLMDPVLLPDLVVAATDGYLAGLRAGGWRCSGRRPCRGRRDGSSQVLLARSSGVVAGRPRRDRDLVVQQGRVR